MKILIPVDDNEIDDAQITLLDDVKYWSLVELIEGRVTKTEFFQNRDEISDWVDVVVVKNQKEYVWPFMEENIAVLVAPLQRAIDDIIEAFLFKELHDMNVSY